jgi:hypothetical protein
VVDAERFGVRVRLPAPAGSANGTTPLSASLTLRRYNAPAPIKEIDVTFPADLPEAAA